MIRRITPAIVALAALFFSVSAVAQAQLGAVFHVRPVAAHCRPMPTLTRIEAHGVSCRKAERLIRRIMPNPVFMNGVLAPGLARADRVRGYECRLLGPTNGLITIACTRRAALVRWELL